MRTFQQQIEALTGITVGVSTNPSRHEVTQFLRDGVKDMIRKLVSAQAPIGVLSSFSKTDIQSSSTGVESPSNVIISVLRNDGTVMNPAREIPHIMKGRAADSNSLSFASKYNPVFYKEQNKVYVLPVPTNETTDRAEIVHIVFDNGVSYNSLSIENFPESSEYLIVYYASAMSCLAAASVINATLPTAPADIGEPNFIYDGPELPTPPTYEAPLMDMDLDSILDSLQKDDLDMADKYLDIVEKNLQKYDKEHQAAQAEYNAAANEFEKELSRRMTNADKELGKEVGIFNQKIKKHSSDVQQYATEINEKLTRYKWLLSQYGQLLTQYNQGIMGIAGKPAKSNTGDAVNVPKGKQRQEAEE
tara:strand:+ start:63 stop:1145 length:1083 start_codon:yes stop_codon:yes gene_type:complete